MQTEHLSENALNFFVLPLCSVIFNTVSTHKSLTSVEKFFQSTINRNREIPQYAWLDCKCYASSVLKNGPILSHIFHILILFWSYSRKKNIQ